MPIPLAGLIVQPSPRHRGPGQVKNNCKSKAASRYCTLLHKLHTRAIRSPGAMRRHRVRAWMRACSSGAPGGVVKGGWISPQGSRHGGRLVFRQGRTPCRKTPPTLHGLGGQEARQAHPWGCPFSWLLLFGHAKRSDSVLQDRKLLKALKPSASPNPPTVTQPSTPPTKAATPSGR
jgi:hypothetical protein